MLYPVHYIKNNHDSNDGSHYSFTTYYYTNEKLGSESGRHSDWNAQLVTLGGILSTNTNVYLHALHLGTEPSVDNPLKTMLPIVISYTDSSGEDASFSNPNTDVDNKYTYYSECLVDDASATVIQTDSSGSTMILLNNDTESEDLKVYSVYDGSYTITVSDASHAIALLNHDVSDSVSYTGTTLETTKTSVYDSDHSYNFYSGTVTLTIGSEFSDILVFEHLDASSIDTKFSKLMYSQTCEYGTALVDNVTTEDTETPINSECLLNTSEIKVALQSASSSKYILNYSSGDVYDATLHYGLNVGNYKIKNIPSEYPLAIFNGTVSDKITYTGTTSVGTKFSVVGQGTYTYYSGTVYITVKEIPTNLTALSYGSLNDSSLLETNKLIFDTDCTGDGTYSVCLSSSTPFEVTSEDKVSLNSETFDDVKYPGVHDGYYTFTGVTSSKPIAFASDETTKYTYTGLSYKSSTQNILIQTTSTDASGVSTTTTDVSFDNVTFYYGDVELYVKGEFSELSLYVYDNGSIIRQRLKYTDFCEDNGSTKSQAKTVTCLNGESDMNIVNSSGYKMVLNNETAYDSTLIYGVNFGSYTIKNIPSSHALRFSNENSIDTSKTYMSSFSTFEKVESDISYIYYYGDVEINFNEDLTESNPNILLSFYDDNLVTNSDDLIVFTSECETENSYYIECLDVSSSISVSNSKYLVNGNSEYDSY